MKKVMATLVVLCLAMTAVATACAATETSGQRAVQESGIYVDWLNPGFSYQYIYLRDESEGFCLVEAVINSETDQRKYGYFNLKGELALPMVYDAAYDFRDGRALVTHNGRSYFIDTTGAEILDVTPYSHVDSVFEHDLLRAASASGQFGIIDIAGNVVVPCQYDDAYILGAGAISVYKDGKIALLNGKGEFLTGFDYDYIGFEEDGLMYATRPGGIKGLIDKTGKLVINLNENEYYYFSEGFRSVEQSGKYGFVDTNETVVIPADYDMVSDFADGMAAVKKDGKWGYIDTQGNLCVPFLYDQVSPFEDGLADAINIIDGNYLHTLIDKDGEAIFGQRSYQIIPIGENMYQAYDSGLEGVDSTPPRNLVETAALLDSQGNELTPFYSGSFREFSDGLVLQVGTAPQYLPQVLNKYGTVIIPPVFSKLIMGENGTCLVMVESSGDDGWIETAVGVLQLPADAATRLPDGGSAEAAPTVTPITVYLDGQLLTFDADPILQDGRTLVPMRRIFEALGAEIDWDPDTQTVTATRGETIIELAIGSTEAKIAGDITILDVPALVKNGRTLVPLRFVGEALKAEVDWDEATNSVKITTKE